MLWLLKLINPLKGIAREIARVQITKEHADTEEKRIEAEVELGFLQARSNVLLAEQSNFLTRSVRPFMAYPFGIYIWKVVVWDNVIMSDWANGVTQMLSPEMWAIMMIVVGAYFAFRGGEKLIKMWRN